MLGISKRMKNSVAFRFVVAALLVGLGCYALIAQWSGVGLFFSFLPVVTMSRTEMTKPIPSREFLVLIGVVIVFVLLVVACKWLVPASAASTIERVFRHPAFVVPFGLFLFWSLYRNYKRQKEEADA
jgi:hypothetical protein